MNNQEKTSMIAVIGEVLYDVFPNFRRIGGAPFNFAFHLIRLGFEVKLITRVGADADGKSLRDFMRQNGFDLDYVQIDETHPTGRVMVYPDQAGGHRFDIRKDVAYDYIDYTESTGQLLRTSPALIYFGSLAQRSARSRQTIQRICRQRSPETLFFYDINLRPDGYSRDIIKTSLDYTDILKLNDEELDVIRKMFGLPDDKMSAVQHLLRDYALKRLVLTKGDRGSEVFTATDQIETPPRKNEKYVDSVGAGDAFAAVFAAGYLQKRDMRQNLAAAADFAGRICGIPGAIPEKDDFYQGITI